MFHPALAWLLFQQRARDYLAARLEGGGEVASPGRLDATG